MRGRPTPARRAPTAGGPSLIVAVVSVGLCSSAHWGCSLAVNLDGLSTNQRDGGSPEVDTAGDGDGGKDATLHPAPMDANEKDSADATGDSQEGGGERDARIEPADGHASDMMTPVAEAGAPKGEGDEMDAAAPDAPGGGQDAGAPDSASSEPDATSTDTAPGDVSPEEEVGSGTAADGPPDVGGTSDADTDAHPLACPPSRVRSATLELANGPSSQTACGYVASELPRFYAAVDPNVFDGSAACGGCVIIETPAGMVEARVVDVGPAASPANPTAVAVNRAAISVLAPDGSTLVTKGVDWHFSACTLTTPGMTFKIQTGSNANYAGVLIQNHRYRLVKVEYKIRATYYPLTRTTYNYWVASDGMGTGPFTLRMTDELGQTVEQTGIPLAPGNVFKGEAQFPSCSP